MSTYDKLLAQIRNQVDFKSQIVKLLKEIDQDLAGSWLTVDQLGQLLRAKLSESKVKELVKASSEIYAVEEGKVLLANTVELVVAPVGVGFGGKNLYVQVLIHKDRYVLPKKLLYFLVTSSMPTIDLTGPARGAESLHK